MSKRESRFIADFTFLSNYAPELPNFAYFLAGMCRARSDSSLSSIIQTLLDLTTAEAEGWVSPAHKKLMDGKVYNGKDEDVRAILARIPREKVWEREEGKRGHERDKQGQTECKICMVDAGEAGLEPLNNCGHAFHSECLQNYIQAEISSNHIPLKCPQATCRIEVAMPDIRAKLTPLELDRFISLSLNDFVMRNPERIRSCPTPDCQYVFEYNGETDFRCESCRTRYCLKCMTTYHYGMTCDEYRRSKDEQQLDQEFEKFVKGKNFKQCSNCKFWVERTMGCNHMTCKCGYQFCYQCGGRFRSCLCR